MRDFRPNPSDLPHKHGDPDEQRGLRFKRRKSHVRQETRHEARVRRRLEAEARAEVWGSMSPSERLQALAGRPGEAKRQRHKIALQVASPPPSEV